MPEEVNPYETPVFDQFLKSKAYDKFAEAQWDKFLESPVFKALWELWGETSDYYDELDDAFTTWREAQKEN